MTGILAVCANGLSTPNQLQRGVEELAVEPWLSLDWHTSDDLTVAFGSVAGDVYSGNHSVLSTDGRYQVLIDGCLYNRNKLAALLDPVDPLPENDTELVAQLINRYSLDDIVSQCEGSFLILIWDNERRELIFANDRFGFRPHYYTRSGKSFALAFQVKFLLKLPWVSPELDFTSVTEYFSFQSIFGDRTFFRHVQMLPPASIFTWKVLTGELSIRSYWNFDQIPLNANTSFYEAVEETAELFLRAIQKQTQDPYRYGLFLSAGLDSRMIASAITNKLDPIHAFTFGFKDSRDQVYAAEISQRAKLKHHCGVFESGDWVKEVSAEHIARTEGFLCLFHAHGFHMAPIARQYMDVNLSGFGGDHVMGGSKLLPHLTCQDDKSSLRRSLYRFCLTAHGIGFQSEYELRQLFRDDIWFLPDRLTSWQSMVAALEPFEKLRYENRSDYFHTVYRDHRQLKYYLVLTRRYFEDREPFYDPTLFDFLYSLPAAYRIGRKLQKAVLERIAPDLAKIACSNDNLLPTSQVAPRRLWELRGQGQAWLYRLSRRRFYPPLRAAYQDYSGWLQRDLAEWVKSILLDPRTTTRGIFDAGFTSSVIEQHLSGGEDATWKIGLMLTFELMLRHLLE